MPSRTPPPAKSTAADLLKIRDFGKGLDGDRVAEIIADRARFGRAGRGSASNYTKNYKNRR